jgi:Uma2 family endonuclease
VDAETGVPDYWIVDVEAMKIERHTEPGPGEYARKQRLGLDAVITPVALRDVSLPVRELLGPRPSEPAG